MCSKCGGQGPFRKDASHPDGLSSWCIACRKTRERLSRLADPEKKAAHDRKYYEHNGERVRKRTTAWVAANPEKHKKTSKASSRAWRDRNPEKHRAQLKAWRNSDPANNAETERRRRARKLGCEVRFSLQEWRSVLDVFGHACAYCLRTDRKLTQDHVVPLSKGGAHADGNIVPACKSCNSSKGAKGVLCMLNVIAGRVSTPPRRATARIRVGRSSFSPTKGVDHAERRTDRGTTRAS